MIEYQTFAEFRAAVLALQAPEDLAENMEVYFREQVSSALCDLQTFLPWLRTFNVDFYTKAQVTEFCSASIFQGPVGKVTQLFAFKPGKDCERFHYKKVSGGEIECWMERQRCMCPATEPPSTNIYDSPYCNYVLTGDQACALPYLTAEEDDCRFKSLDDDDRIFTVDPRYKIYAAPRFPCQYMLALQWQGIRRKWLDTDQVPVDQQIRDAVLNFVEEKMARKARILNSAEDYKREYAASLRILKYRYTDEQEPERKRDCTSAISEIVSKFLPIYETATYGPGGTPLDIESGTPLILE